MALSCYIFLSYFSCVFSLSLWCIKIYVGVLCVFIYVGVCVCKRARSALKYSANIKNSGGSSHTTAECQQPPSTDRQRERRKSHSQYIKAFINLKNKVLSWMRPYALKTQRTTTETRCFPIHSILALFTRCFSSFPLILFFLLLFLLFHPNDVADVVLAATTLSVALRLTRLLYYDTKHENSMQRVEEWRVSIRLSSIK